MKLMNMEKLIINSPLRAYMLRKVEVPRVLSDLGIDEGSICLEIGCGNGIGALLVNQYLNCERIVGIDIDPDMVTAAKKCMAHPPKWAQNIRTDNIEFLCEDATRLTFSDRYFDAVFLFGVLHHMSEWKQVISEVCRVLKEGGMFSFSEEVLVPSLLSHWKLISRAYRTFGGVPISKEELKGTLEETGFCIRSFKTILSSACCVRAVKEGE